MIHLLRYETVKRVQSWQVLVCGAVLAYLMLAAVTASVHVYHWFMLLLIPSVLLAREATQRFLLDWAPIIAFWLVYDRLRLAQRFILSRVAVEWPYNLERALFGWLGGGDVPAHTWRAWLTTHHGEWSIRLLSPGAQLVYFSHLFAVPLLLVLLWARARNNTESRDRFREYVRAFTALHVMAVLCYVLIPVAPPWWVSLHSMSVPTPELVAHTSIQHAMDGVIIQRLIGNASQWFAAVPSLHGAYPMLVLMLERKSGWRVLTSIAIYCAAMWASTVALNQHYFIDLAAGMAAAFAAYWIGGAIGLRAAADDSDRADARGYQIRSGETHPR